MKKSIVLKKEALSKFQASEISALSTISGGTANVKTNTNMYLTESSADDADTGDHDTDGIA
jgi:hypothetical protein